MPTMKQKWKACAISYVTAFLIGVSCRSQGHGVNDFDSYNEFAVHQGNTAWINCTVGDIVQVEDVLWQKCDETGHVCTDIFSAFINRKSYTIHTEDTKLQPRLHFVPPTSLAINQFNTLDAEHVTYLCLINKEGRSRSTLVKLHILGVPVAPHHVRLSPTSSSITVRWIAGFDGGSAQLFHLEYKLYRAVGSTVWNTSIGLPNGVSEDTLLNATIRGLKPETLYSITLWAHNNYRKSSYVVKVGRTTAIPTLNITGVYLTHTFLNISWVVLSGAPHHLRMDYKDDEMSGYKKVVTDILARRGRLGIRGTFNPMVTYTVRVSVYETEGDLEEPTTVVYYSGHVTQEPSSVWNSVLLGIIITLGVLILAVVIYGIVRNRRRMVMLLKKVPAEDGPVLEIYEALSPGIQTRPRTATDTNGVQKGVDNPEYHFCASTDSFPRDRLRFARSHHVTDNSWNQSSNISIMRARALLFGSNGWSSVMVKILKGDNTLEEENAFMKELEAMKMLPANPYIVNFIGCCTIQKPYLSIVEYVHNDNLRDYLQSYKHRKEADDSRRRVLLTFCLHVARGMAVLEYHNIVHQDLRCENIYLNENMKCRISCFGIVKEEDANSIDTKNILEDPLRSRWLPPEAFTDSVLTLEGNVWTFGVLLWEIFSLGCVPFSEPPSTDAFSKIRQGEILSSPELANTETYDLMKSCCDVNPEKRPYLNTVVKVLEKLQRQSMGILLSDQNIIFNTDS